MSGSVEINDRLFMPLLLAAYESPKSQRKLTALARERPYLPPGEGIFFVPSIRLRKAQAIYRQHHIFQKNIPFLSTYRPRPRYNIHNYPWEGAFCVPEQPNKPSRAIGLLAHVDAGRGGPQNSPVAPLGEEKEKREKPSGAASRCHNAIFSHGILG